MIRRNREKKQGVSHTQALVTNEVKSFASLAMALIVYRQLRGAPWLSEGISNIAHREY